MHDSAALYAEYRVPVYRYARNWGLSPEDAEDVTQDVFVRVLRSLDRYEDRGFEIRAWLFRIALNLLRDRHRRHRQAPGMTIPIPDNFDCPDPASTVEYDEIADLDVLAGPLLALKPHEQAAVLLPLLRPGTNAEISRRSGTASVTTFQHRRMRGHARLRAMVKR